LPGEGTKRGRGVWVVAANWNAKKGRKAPQKAKGGNTRVGGYVGKSIEPKKGQKKVCEVWEGGSSTFLGTGVQDYPLKEPGWGQKGGKNGV